MCEIKHSRKDGKKMSVVYFNQGYEKLDLDDEHDRKNSKCMSQNRGTI